MALSNLFNVPRDEHSMSEMTFNNYLSHLAISKAIAERGGGNVAVPILDPIPKGKDVLGWGEIHQSLHNVQNAILNLPGNDLTDVDWNQENQVAAWTQLHAWEHYQAHLLLGI